MSINVTLNEVKQQWKEEWANIPPQSCDRLIQSSRQALLRVTDGKGGPTSSLNVDKKVL